MKNALVVTILALLSACDRGPYPVPSTEPPEDVLVKILESQYAAIRDAGGQTVTLTSSGRSTSLMPRIWEAKKLGCKPLPRSEPGQYECSLDLKVTFLEGDDTPRQHAERVHVSWDVDQGEWVDSAQIERANQK
jgi:hypothetical protein